MTYNLIYFITLHSTANSKYIIYPHKQQTQQPTKQISSNTLPHHYSYFSSSLSSLELMYPKLRIVGLSTFKAFFLTAVNWKVMVLWNCLELLICSVPFVQAFQNGKEQDPQHTPHQGQQFEEFLQCKQKFQGKACGSVG